ADAIAAVSLAGLAALRDRSLVQCIMTDPDTRYALHPLLQRLARERLAGDAALEAAMHARHARYFGGLAAQYERRLRGSEGAAILNTLEHEMDNLRAGWRWAIAARDIATLGAYSVVLHDICAMHGWGLEGRQLFGGAAAVVRAWAAGTAAEEEQIVAAA